MRLPSLFLLVVAGFFPGCKAPPRTTDATRDGGSSAISANASAAAAKYSDAGPHLSRRGKTDVTFVVASDTHFGFGYPDDATKLSPDPFAKPVGLESANRVLITRLNALAGHAYPEALGGGTVAPPRGLLITGDLTEWGQKREWERFVAYYGLTGTEGALRMPVFEAVGNHDRIPGPWVEQQVSARHGGRFYAFDWDDVHFVALGEAPDDEGLAWLERDLSRLDMDVPLVVYLHRALLGPWSDDNWFGDGTYRDRLAHLLEGRAVLALFHGHHHAAGHYLWHGFHVYKPGAVKDDAHTVAVVHVTDGEITVGYYNYDEDAWKSSYRQKRKPSLLLH